MRLGIKSGVGLFACCVLFTGAGIARWWDNDKEADDTRALAAWLAAPAITVPTDIALPDAHEAPMLRRPLLLRPTTWDVLSERDRDLVEVPWTVPLTKWNGHTTEVRIQTQPLAPELYVSNRSIRLPIAELAIDLPSPCSHHCLDDAMTKVRLALAWAGGELRALPLLHDDGMFPAPCVPDDVERDDAF